MFVHIAECVSTGRRHGLDFLLFLFESLATKINEIRSLTSGTEHLLPHVETNESDDNDDDCCNRSTDCDT